MVELAVSAITYMEMYFSFQTRSLYHLKAILRCFKSRYWNKNCQLKAIRKLSKIFDWPIYEKSTLGNESKRKWYAVILSQWMEGSGLSYIM